MIDRSSKFQGGEEEEIGIVCESHVRFGRSFVNLELDDWRWIDWATVRGSYDQCQSKVSLRSNSPECFRAFLHFAPEPQALALSGCCMTFK